MPTQLDIYGGSRPSSASSRTGRNIAQVTKGAGANYPKLLDMLVGAITAQTPRYAENLLDIYKQYAAGFSQVGSELAQQNQQEAAQTDLGLLKGVGRDITQATTENMRLADPEYFSTRALLSSKAGDLLDGQDPNKLTGAELANVERGLNRLNPNYAGSNTQTLSNALVFGDRLSQKRAVLSDTLGQVGGMLNSFITPAFNYDNATGKQGLANAGQEIFKNVTNLTGQGFGIGSNLLNQAGAINMNERNIEAETIPGWQQIIEAGNSMIGSQPDY